MTFLWRQQLVLSAVGESGENELDKSHFRHDISRQVGAGTWRGFNATVARV